MALERLDIHSCEPYADGREFGEVGAFELIRATARYAVDPSAEDESRIADLDLAPRDSDGCVRFHGDLVLIRPVDPQRGNGALLIDVPNRGRPIMIGRFNSVPAEIASGDPYAPGDGFLMQRGFSVGFVGWQWNAPNTPEMPDLLQFSAPEADLSDAPAGGPQEAITDLRPSSRLASIPILHLGQPGYPVADLDDPHARLCVRDYEDDEPREVPREQWRFAREQDGEIVASAGDVWLDGGFEPGRIYEVVYRTNRSPVVGAGLLAFRDAALFLRGWQRGYERMLAFGASQSGRFLRHLLYLGLNRGVDGVRAYDGMQIHIAGALRGEFNHRYGQPSQLFLASHTHEFPFADIELDDPLTGRRDGLLRRSDEQGVTPKVVATNTSWEYYRGDASLIHIEPLSGQDIPQHPNTRHYLFAGTQHSAGLAEATDSFYLTDDRSRYRHNAVDYTPLNRAALIHLDRWIANGTEPPPSAVPGIANGTAASRADILAEMAQRFCVPSAERLSRVRTLDLDCLPAEEGETYPSYASTLDADGNELAGWRLPDLSQPLGVHTGWNPRHPDTGGADLMSAFVGLTQWFDRDEILRRYADRKSYLARVRSDAEQRAAEGVLLTEDVELVVRNCTDRWDVAMAERG